MQDFSITRINLYKCPICNEKVSKGDETRYLSIDNIFICIACWIDEQLK